MGMIASESLSGYGGYMAVSTETYLELKSALKDALIELVQEQSDLFRDIVKEALEESALTEQSTLIPSSDSDSDSDDPFEQQVQAEIQAYHELHPMLWETYPGEYAAVHNQSLVDHDKDYTALYQRIDKAYPDKFVLLRQVEKEPERDLRMRSPRLVPNPS